MLRVMLIGAQVAGGAEAWSLPKGSEPGGLGADLHVVQACARDRGDDDVVVCGIRDPGRFRLKPLPERFEKEAGSPLAQTGLGGGTIGVVTQQVMIGNNPSNRVLLRWKLPF